MFRIFAGDLCARYIYGHVLIHPGVRTAKGAGQTGNANLIPRQNALFHNSVDRGVRIGVIEFLSEDGPYSADFPKGTNAGEYTVWYRIQETANYTGEAPQSVKTLAFSF